MCVCTYSSITTQHAVKYNIKMILEGIITRLRTDLGCLKPEMVV